MTNFLEGFLIVMMIFCFCVGIAFVIRLIIAWIVGKPAKSEPTVAEPTVYFVKQTQSKPKRKRARRKSPSVALKGLMITPEKFEALKNNNFEE
ncbi:MAG: hypothetical protein IJW64_01305 [Clostridia bacterium]|nr:hypothetical protein [Clostridia bacterium]